MGGDRWGLRALRRACAALAVTAGGVLSATPGAHADAFLGPETAIPNGGQALTAAMGPDGAALAAGYTGSTLSLSERSAAGGWSPAQRFSVPAGSSSTPLVRSAMGAGGAAIVAASPYGDTSTPFVFVRDPGQGSFAPSTVPVSASGAAPNGYQVAMTSGGTALLTWEANDALQDIHAATRVPGGGSTDLGQVGPNATVGGPPALSATTAAADDGSGAVVAFGTAAAFAPGFGAAGVPEVVLRTLNADGTLGSPRSLVVGPIPTATDVYSVWPEAVAVAPDGSIEVAYLLNDEHSAGGVSQTLGVARFGADGTDTNSAPLDTGSAGTASLGPVSIAFDGAGASTVAWYKAIETTPTSVQLLAATRPGPGQPFGAPQTMESSVAGDDGPLVDSLGDGRVIFIGGAYNGPGAAIRSQGQAMFGPLSAPIASPTFQPPVGTIAGDGVGQVIFAYDSNNQVDAVLFDRNATPTAPRTSPKAPALTDLAIRPRRFTARARVAWRLSAPGSVAFTVSRVRRGVRAFGRCRIVRRAAAGARRCTRVRAVRRITVTQKAKGVGHLVLRAGRGRRDLAPGSYRLSALPLAAGAIASRATGSARVVTFEVVRGHRGGRHHGALEGQPVAPHGRREGEG